jgi:hypothetical protein
MHGMKSFIFVTRADVDQVIDLGAKSTWMATTKRDKFQKKSMCIYELDTSKHDKKKLCSGTDFHRRIFRLKV